MAACYPWIPDSSEHVCKEKNYQKPYSCDGCLQPGFGPRFRCDQCDMTLHPNCNNPKPSIQRFTFHKIPPLTRHGTHERYCDACGKIIIGFEYHCRRDKTELDFHPCCTNLQETYLIGGYKFTLHRVAMERKNCTWCKKTNINGSDKTKIKGWSYKFGNDYCIHVYCVTEMMLEEWRKKVNRARVINQPLSLGNVNLNAQASSSYGGGGRSSDEDMNLDSLMRLASFLLGDPTGEALLLFSA